MFPQAGSPNFGEYLQYCDMKGAGWPKAYHKLHVQAILECTVPCDKAGEAAFQNNFKAYIYCGITAGAKLTKPFSAGQTFTHMLGYIQTDEGQEHFKLVTH